MVIKLISITEMEDPKAMNVAPATSSFRPTFTHRTSRLEIRKLRAI